MLSAGELTAGHARALLPLESEKKIKEAAAQVVLKELSVRETEELVKSKLKSFSGCGIFSAGITGFSQEFGSLFYSGSGVGVDHIPARSGDIRRHRTRHRNKLIIGQFNTSLHIVSRSQRGAKFEVVFQFFIPEIKSDIPYFKLWKTNKPDIAFCQCRNQFSSGSRSIGFIFIERMVIQVSAQEHEVSCHRLADEKYLYSVGERQWFCAVIG